MYYILVEQSCEMAGEETLVRGMLQMVIIVCFGEVVVGNGKT